MGKGHDWARGKQTLPIPSLPSSGKVGQAGTRTTFNDDDDDADRKNAIKPVTGKKMLKSKELVPKEKVSTVHTVVRDDGTEVPAKLNNKVFVDGLPFKEPEGASLQQQLAEFVAEWKVGKVVHLTKKEGQGFGYLSFHSPNSVDVAVRVLNGRKFLGRALRVEVPKPPKPLRPNAQESKEQKANAMESYTRQVLLSDLPKDQPPEVIREAIREYAPNLEARIDTIKVTGSQGRKAFLTFYNDDDVAGAVEFLNGFKLLGRRIEARAAQPPGALPFSKPQSVAQMKKRTRETEDDQEAKPMTSASSMAIQALTKNNKEEKFPMPNLIGASAGANTKRKDNAVSFTSTPKHDSSSSGNQSMEVLVGDLADSTTEESLRQHFSSCGRVLRAELLLNQFTKDPTGLAKVQFAAPAQARYAKENLNFSKLDGAVIRVDRVGEPGEAFVPGQQRTKSKEHLNYQEDVENEDDASSIDEEGFARERYGVKDVKKFLNQKKNKDDDDDILEVVGAQKTTHQRKNYFDEVDSDDDGDFSPTNKPKSKPEKNNRKKHRFEPDSVISRKDTAPDDDDTVGRTLPSARRKMLQKQEQKLNKKYRK